MVETNNYQTELQFSSVNFIVLVGSKPLETRMQIKNKVDL